MTKSPSAPDKASGLATSTTPTFLSRAVNNLAFSSVGLVANFVLGLLFAGLTIRYLGEARAGYFLTISTLTGFGVIFGDFGLGTPAVRKVAQLHTTGDFASMRKIIGSVYLASLITALIIAIPIVAFFPSIFAWSKLSLTYKSDAWLATLLTAGTFVLFQSSNSWRATYNALERYDLISGLNTIWGLISGIGSIAVLTLMPNMAAISIFRFSLAVARYFVDAGMMNYLLHGVPWPCWAWTEVRPLLRFGGWVYVGSFGQLLLDRVSSLILITFLGSAALPVYELPQRFFAQIHNLLASQSQFLFPMFASFGEDTSSQIALREDRLRWLLAVASSICYTGLALVSYQLVAHVAGADFAARAQIAMLLVCIQGFLHAQDILPYYSTWAMGSGKPNALYTLIAGSSAALLTLVLAPQMGAIGASLSLAVCSTLAIGFAIIIRKQITPQLSTFSYFEAFVSPIAMSLTWIGVVALLSRLSGVDIVRSNDPLNLLMSAAIGGILGVAALCIVEIVFFARRQRVATVVRILSLSRQKLTARLELVSKHS